MPCEGAACCSLDSSQVDSELYAHMDEALLKEYQSQLNTFWHCRQYNFGLRFAILLVQTLALLLTLALAIAVFCARHTKIIRHSMWPLLELLLAGAALLYSTLLLQYFEPSPPTCLALPWFRELGFTLVYGTLNLRLYKLLVEFQSRKAHCVQLRDKDILRLLLGACACVAGYLVAWTLGDLDYASEGFSLVTNTSLRGYIQYPICKVKWWDYFIEIGRFLTAI